jgi:hypothetical protein
LKPVFIIAIVFSITIALVGVVAMTNTVDDTSAAKAADARAAADKAVTDDSPQLSSAWEKYHEDRINKEKAVDPIIDRYGSYFEYQKHLKMEFMEERYNCGEGTVGEGALKKQYNKCQP